MLRITCECKKDQLFKLWLAHDPISGGQIHAECNGCGKVVSLSGTTQQDK